MKTQTTFQKNIQSKNEKYQLRNLIQWHAYLITHKICHVGWVVQASTVPFHTDILIDFGLIVDTSIQNRMHMYIIV